MKVRHNLERNLINNILSKINYIWRGKITPSLIIYQLRNKLKIIILWNIYINFILYKYIYIYFKIQQILYFARNLSKKKIVWLRNYFIFWRGMVTSRKLYYLSGKSSVWNEKYGVENVECQVWYVKCGVNVECKSVKYKVSNIKCRV